MLLTHWHAPHKEVREEICLEHLPGPEDGQFRITQQSALAGKECLVTPSNRELWYKQTTETSQKVNKKMEKILRTKMH